MLLVPAVMHLLREDSIDKAVEAFPEAESIYERNMETLEKIGIEGWLDMGVGARCPVAHAVPAALASKPGTAE